MAGRISFGIWGKKLSCVKRNWNKMELAVHLICINTISIDFVKHLGIICWITYQSYEVYNLCATMGIVVYCAWIVAAYGSPYLLSFALQYS